jgi:excisionase family DNA binding protein
MQTFPQDTLLTAARLAARLGVKPETVLRWHRDGKIPARKLSHKVLRFDLAEVVAALEASQRLEGRGVVQ